MPHRPISRHMNCSTEMLVPDLRQLPLLNMRAYDSRDPEGSLPEQVVFELSLCDELFRATQPPNR